MTARPLEHIDVHSVLVLAGVDTTWRALLDSLAARRHDRGWRAAVMAVGAVPALPGRGPLDTLGAELPGFEVCELEPPRLIALRGWHHFAAYRLRFRLEPDGAGRTRLSAESEAMFPGRAGAVYRRLILGTGLHVMATTGLLKRIRRLAERT